MGNHLVMWGGGEGSQALDQGWLDTFGQEHLSVEEIHRILNLPSPWQKKKEHDVLVLPSQWRQRTFTSSTDSGLGSPIFLSSHGNESLAENETSGHTPQASPQEAVTEGLDLGDMQSLLEIAQELQSTLHPAPSAMPATTSQHMMTTSWKCGQVSHKLDPRDCDPCRVCREPAGQHSYYGGQVCLSCKAFFRLGGHLVEIMMIVGLCQTCGPLFYSESEVSPGAGC